MLACEAGSPVCTFAGHIYDQVVNLPNRRVPLILYCREEAYMQQANSGLYPNLAPQPNRKLRCSGSSGAAAFYKFPNVIILCQSALKRIIPPSQRAISGILRKREFGRNANIDELTFLSDVLLHEFLHASSTITYTPGPTEYPFVGKLDLLCELTVTAWLTSCVYSLRHSSQAVKFQEHAQ